VAVRFVLPLINMTGRSGPRTLQLVDKLKEVAILNNPFDERLIFEAVNRLA
jgi:hypothetical protein